MEENIGYIEDPTVTVEATPAILEYISGNPELQSLVKEESLTKIDLKRIVDVMYQDDSSKYLKGENLDKALLKMIDNNEKFPQDCSNSSLHELLHNTNIKLPANPVIERSPELTARLERLKLEQNERAYQAMTKSISPGKFHKEDTISYQLNNMNRELIAVGQVILSVAAGFAFGFLGIPLIVGGMEFGVRVLLGLFFAGIIAIAELYFLAKYMHYEDVQQRVKKD